MKAYAVSLAIAGFVFLASITSCQEETPFVVGATVTLDTTFVNPVLPPIQDRLVLLEDFTGVQCVNCPDAHELAKTLSETYPGRVIPVSEHNYFEGAFPNSDEDFRNDESFAIDALIGPTTLWPIGTVNRKRFAGEPAVLLTLPKWTGYVASEIAESPVVNVTVQAQLNSTSRVLNIVAEAHFLQSVSEATRLSVMVLESDIIDPQQTDTGKKDDYVHDHVLRIMPTPATGALLTTTTEQGRVVRRGYDVQLADHWNLNNLEVVAFIHLGELTDISVLQVAHILP
jgi:hypothetical protein